MFEETEAAATRERPHEVFQGVSGESAAAERAPEPSPPAEVPALDVQPETPAPEEEPAPVPTVWRDWFGGFALFWLLDIFALLYIAKQGLPGDPELAKQVVFLYLGKVGALLLMAGVLTFAVPLALVDQSSHHRRAWWMAWLWPLVLAGMVLADVLIAGASLVPAIKVLKPD